MLRYDSYYEVKNPPEIGEKVWVTNWAGTNRVAGEISGISRMIAERPDPMASHCAVPLYLPPGWVVLVFVPSDQRYLETRFVEEMRFESLGLAKQTLGEPLWRKR